MTQSSRTIFFFQAEDGIRDADVTGVQTCALPISVGLRMPDANVIWFDPSASKRWMDAFGSGSTPRSEERRVGKECRSRWRTSYKNKRMLSICICKPSIVDRETLEMTQGCIPSLIS